MSRVASVETTREENVLYKVLYREYSVWGQARGEGERKIDVSRTWQTDEFVEIR